MVCMVLEGAEGWTCRAEEGVWRMLVVVQSPWVGSTPAWWVHPREVVFPFSLGSFLGVRTGTASFC